MSKSLLLVLSLILLSGCSKAHVSVQMQPPPADLAQKCQDLPPLPNPLIDPARLEYEAELIAMYGECAARHYKAIEAWNNATSTP